MSGIRRFLTKVAITRPPSTKLDLTVTPPSGMEDPTLPADWRDQATARSHGLALEDICRNNALEAIELVRQGSGLQISVDALSLKYVDAVLLGVSPIPTEVPDDGPTGIFGSYLGETIIRTHGGRWATPRGDLAVALSDGSFVYPTQFVHFLLHHRCDHPAWATILDPLCAYLEECGKPVHRRFR